MAAKYYSNKFIEVSDVVPQIPDIDQYSPEMIYKSAIEHYNKEDLIKAEYFFIKCFKADGISGIPSEVRASCAHYLAEISIIKKYEIVGIFFLKKATELSDHPLYQKSAGGYIASLGRLSEAFPYLEKCLNSDLVEQFTSKDKAECAYWLGITHITKATEFYNPEKAVEYQKMAIELDPTEVIFTSELVPVMTWFEAHSVLSVLHDALNHAQEL